MTRLRSEPYRLLFPLGVVLAWSGVMPWLLLGVGAADSYPSISHALVQIQGFVACFVAGFLLTFVPRRTGGAPASMLELAIAAIGPVGVTVSAWSEQWALSQMFWLAFAGMLLLFVIRRFANAPAGAAPPATAAWIPMSLLASIAGSLLTAAGAAGGPDRMWLHDIGRAMVLHGFPTGLVLGAGAFLLPVITRGVPPRDATSGERVLHAVAAIAFFTSFVLDAWSLRLGPAIRAAIAIAILAGAAGLHRLPTLPGAHRRLAWVSAWCVPLGFALLAAFPSYRRIALHVTLLGGFASLSFAVSIQVAHAHAMKTPRAGLVRSLCALLAIALGARAAMEFDPGHYTLWIAVASGAFLASTLVWAWTVTAALAAKPRPGGAHALPIR